MRLWGKLRAGRSGLNPSVFSDTLLGVPQT